MNIYHDSLVCKDYDPLILNSCVIAHEIQKNMKIDEKVNKWMLAGNSVHLIDFSCDNKYSSRIHFYQQYREFCIANKILKESEQISVNFLNKNDIENSFALIKGEK